MAGRVRDRAGGAGGWSLVAAALALVAVIGTAHADNVDVLLKDLSGGRDFKVRLAAALSLARLGDPRAIPGFLAALDDSDKTVRGAAVVGLGKVVDASSSELTRKRVVAALDKLAHGDPSDPTTRQAIKTRDAIAKLGPSVTVTAGGYYINLAPMTAKAKGTEALRDLMRETAQKGLLKVDPRITVTWPNGKEPTQKDLDKAKVRGYYVDGAIQEVTVVEKGSASLVSCKISMLIATFPGKSIFGFLEGGAKVQGSNTPKDIEAAKQDCVTAVVEDLVAKKIMPTIQTKAGPNL
ncbi:MAG TPA: HEAT repeat domain-containing protein [Kofleriaceae bacterium]|nr:HEAT repeat domain-containing protein [Kofleriaceae bacterium]